MKSAERVSFAGSPNTQDCCRDIIFTEEQARAGMTVQRFWDVIRTGNAVLQTSPLGFAPKSIRCYPIHTFQLDRSQGRLKPNEWMDHIKRVIKVNREEPS